MADDKKRVRLVAYDADGKAPREADVEYGEGETVGEVFARTFPGSEEGRIYAKTKPMDSAERMSIADLAAMRSFITQGDGTMFEFSIKAIREDPSIDLMVTPSILHLAVDTGDGFLTVNVGGKPLTSYKIRAKQIQLPAASVLYYSCTSPSKRKVSGVLLGCCQQRLVDRGAGNTLVAAFRQALEDDT